MKEWSFLQRSDEGNFLSRSRGCVLRASKNDRTISYRLSDDSIDRQHSRVISSGIETGEYAANPIFLWAHDSSGGGIFGGGPPDMESVIGRTVSWEVTKLADKNAADWATLAKRYGVKMQPTEAFDIVVEHAPADVNPQGERSLRMVRAGFLNSTSIGAMIDRGGVEQQKSGIKGIPPITVYTKTAIVEGSLVPIPANPNAAALARAVVSDYDLLDTFNDDDAASLQRWVSESREAPASAVEQALGSKIANAIAGNLVTGERSKLPQDRILDAVEEGFKRAGF